MAFWRIKKIGDREYWYEETRYREGGKVRSRSKYLGPVAWLRKLGDLIESNRTKGPVIDYEKHQKEVLEREAKEKEAKAAALEKMHELYGMKAAPDNPTPAEKESPPISGGPDVTPVSGK